jgi:ribonuclease VapC
MIVVDTSVLVAIAFYEPERENFLQIMKRTETVLISTVSLVESQMVVHNKVKGKAGIEFNTLLKHPALQFKSPSFDDAKTAYEAFLKYGKGQGHKAQLNICDLFAYALAKNRDLPLLFKGNDFAYTDVKQAV